MLKKAFSAINAKKAFSAIDAKKFFRSKKNFLGLKKPVFRSKNSKNEVLGLKKR